MQYTTTVMGTNTGIIISRNIGMISTVSLVSLQAYMVGPSGVLRKALFSRGVASRLVAVRGLLYIIVQQLRTMDDGGHGEGDETLEADPELSLSQVPTSTPSCHGYIVI